MKDKTWLEIYRMLEKVFYSKWFNVLIMNFEKDRYGWHLEQWNRFYLNCNRKVFDYIDFIYGPSECAELSAQRTGYWNLEAAREELDQYHEKDRKKVKPFIYWKYQVKKY